MIFVYVLLCLCFFFFNDTATTEIYTYGHTLSLHDALPIYHPHGSARHAHSLQLAWQPCGPQWAHSPDHRCRRASIDGQWRRSEEHTSELQSLMRISYAVFCLQKNKIK